MPTSTGLNQALADDLFAIYTDAEFKMLERLAKRIKQGITERGWTEEKLEGVQKLKAEIEEVMNNKTKLAKTLTSKGIIDAYKSGVAGASKDLGTPASIMTSLGIPPHIQVLILNTHNLIDMGQVQVLRNVQDVYRQVIANTSTNVLTGVDTPQQAAQDALNRFANRGITGFVDVANRHWELASYVEMATRTTTAHAALQGHIDRQAEIGNDLMKVSSIGTTCPICARWQGRVVSISGHDSNYPSLDSARADGLFHPNCKHTVTAYFPEIDDAPVANSRNNEWLYWKTQEQRYNERQIRQWKKRDAVALTPAEHTKAQNKIREWQGIQRQLIDETGLRRNYAREGIVHRTGNPDIVSTTVRKSIKKPGQR